MLGDKEQVQEGWVVERVIVSGGLRIGVKQVSTKDTRLNDDKQLPFAQKVKYTDK